MIGRPQDGLLHAGGRIETLPYTLLADGTRAVEAEVGGHGRIVSGKSQDGPVMLDWVIPAGESFPMHDHPFAESLMVMTGRIGVRRGLSGGPSGGGLPKDATVVLEAGDVCSFNTHELHAVTALGKADARLVVLWGGPVTLVSIGARASGGAIGGA